MSVGHPAKSGRVLFLLVTAFLLLAVAARAYGLLFMFESAERYSPVLAIAGLILMIAGRRTFRIVFWILMFLILMVPFPGRVHNMISGPLQITASTGAVSVLERFMPVILEGNVITLSSGIGMDKVEACSELRMPMAFLPV